MIEKRGPASDGTAASGTVRHGGVRVGPARSPSRESPERAVELLLDRGYSACEIDFESGFWLDYPAAERLGELAREHDLALSIHAPLFAFPGPPGREEGKAGAGCSRPHCRDRDDLRR